MLHLPDLIRDLGVILATASIVVLIFKKLKQPVVLGYLAAGFLVGPHFDLFPTVKETKNIQTWAEIGVIFMLFGLGLEFSFKKLFQVGKSAAITASFEVLFMLGAGYLLGQAFGWNKMDSLFLGGILSISSTTIIVRAFDEMNLKARGFVSLVFGVLIVEDLLAILLLVVMSSVAVSKAFSGEALIFSSLKLVFFMMVWFILGIYFLPTLLKRTKKLLSDETILIVSVALCLIMVIVASSVGFSPALGAFVMGSLFAETQEGKRIEHLIVPIKDLFSAIFFVSVGMLIDLSIVKDHFWTILIVTFVTVFGKFVSSTMGALLSGTSVKNAVQSGMSLAQIGEFSFIIATLGVSLNVTSAFLYPLAVVVSAITTLLTPYMIRLSGDTAQMIEGRISENIRAQLLQYQNAMNGHVRSGPLRLVWQEYGLKILFNSVVVIALSLFISDFVSPMIHRWLAEHLDATSMVVGTLINMTVFLFALAACSPFLWAICFGRASHQKEYDADTVDQLRKLQWGVSIGRFLIGGALIFFLFGQYINVLATSGFLLVMLFICFLFLFSRRSSNMYKVIEDRFMTNLTEKEKHQLESKQQLPELAPWDHSLNEIVVDQDAYVVGLSLEEVKFREKFGVSVVMIQRGTRRILAPPKSERIFPLDRLFIIGNEDSVLRLRELVENVQKVVAEEVAAKIGLYALKIQEGHHTVGKTIRDSGIRELSGGIIVGVERGAERILNPNQTFVIQPMDLLWIVGNQEVKTLL